MNVVGIKPWFLVTVLLACNPSKDYLVRVGDATLYHADLDSLQGDWPSVSRNAFVQQWITSEALYQRALKEGLADQPAFRRQMETIRKEMLIQKLMEQEVDRAITVSSSEIESYYRDHLSEFTYAEDRVKVEYFWTKDRNKIRDVTQKFASMSRLRKRDFMDIVSPMGNDSDIVGASEYLIREKFEERVGRAIFARTAIDEIVGPIALSSGFFSLWHVVDIRPKKTPAPLSEVTTDIEAKLRGIKKKSRTDELIKKLRSEAKIEYGPPEGAASN